MPVMRETNRDPKRQHASVPVRPVSRRMEPGYVSVAGEKCGKNWNGGWEMKCQTKTCRYGRADMDDYCTACRELRDMIRPPAITATEIPLPHEWTREADETADMELATLDALEVTPAWKE